MLSRRSSTRVKLLASALALAALCTSATTARAQDNEAPRVHQGFWIGGGLGYGSVSSSCDGCGSSDSEGGFSGLLRLGGTLSEQVLLGVESDGWYKDINGTTNCAFGGERVTRTTLRWLTTTRSCA